MEELGMSRQINSFKTKEELIENFSKKIIENLKEGIRKRAKATLLVSGGSTPKPLFEKLSKSDIDWSCVKIGLVDERWVDENHKDSNAKLVKDFLLVNKASKAAFIPIYQKGVEAKEARKKCSNLVKNELFPCDVLILGMGDDGHTASLFPNKEELKDALDLSNESYCISMTPNDAPHTRMSLTLSAILKAQNLYLHIQGKNKIKVYEKAIHEQDSMKSPIAAVLKNDIKDIKVYYNE